MGMMPFQILAIWLRGLLSLALLILGPYLIYKWYNDSHVMRAIPRVSDVPEPSAPADEVKSYERVFAPSWGLNVETTTLALGVGVTLWAIPKGPALSLRRLRRPKGKDEPACLDGRSHKIERPDGSTIHAETFGPPDGQPIVLTHGWGMDSHEWYYVKKVLSRYKLIVWDLPGLGRSSQSLDRDFSLENLARDLELVLALTNDKPAVLIGHSIGGMISLTHLGIRSNASDKKICGLVLVNTTYTNPVKTTSMAGLKVWLQKPLLEPLMYLTIWLSPLVRLMNWLSYWNGSTHASTERSSFSGNETRGQLDFIASYSPRSSPAVIARGMLGMLKYDATSTLPTLEMPTLIITAEDDSVCLPAASETMRAAIPDAELFSFPKARHSALLERHTDFNRMVDEFMKKCSRVQEPVEP